MLLHFFLQKGKNIALVVCCRLAAHGFVHSSLHVIKPSCRNHISPVIFCTPVLCSFTKQIGKECITCVQDDPIIKEGDILLTGADLGKPLHYACARRRRKDYFRVVFAAQDKRHASYLERGSGNSAEKKAKLEAEQAAFTFSVLAPDSDDEI